MGNKNDYLTLEDSAPMLVLRVSVLKSDVSEGELDAKVSEEPGALIESNEDRLLKRDATYQGRELLYPKASLVRQADSATES